MSDAGTEIGIMGGINEEEGLAYVPYISYTLTRLL